MAYRRRQYQQQQTTTSSATTRVSSVSTSDNDDFQLGGDNEGFGHDADVSGGSSTSLAARAIKASSAARRDSSLSSAYGFNQRSPAVAAATTADYSSFSGSKQGITGSSYSSNMDSKSYEYTSMKNLNESKQGFWGALARKAKSILEDDDSPQQVDSPRRTMQNAPQASAKLKYQNPYSNESQQKTEQPALQKGLNAISSSLNYFGNAVEEGLTVMENRTAGIIQETRKHIRKKPGSAATQNQATNCNNMWQAQTQAQPQTQTDLELQLKASRDVAMAMAAKAKLLLRELKTVKADLAFAKERCGQLEEENRVLRETRDRGEDPEDDDLVRLQLETLLAEKARLAHENSVYARENRFLREVVEYHQLTMQDVVYLDEGTEEVTEVYPIKVVSNSHPPAPLDKTLGVTQDIPPHPVPPPGLFS